jgi:DMSO/TMAO reductase YedYZ molybdopterin-dependent catalytic subunit
MADDREVKAAKDDVQVDRVVAARLRLMERFAARMAETPSLTDDKPQGEGPPNRHGMPRVPVDQIVTEKWPVLDLGVDPAVDTSSFRLVVDGAVGRPLTLSYSDLLALPQTDDVSDFHCVTTWSKFDMPWRGVRVSTILALAEVTDGAAALMCHASDGYTTNVTLEEALKDDVLLAHTVYGAPLGKEHGGPVRMITPQLYAWKGAKWISRIEVRLVDKPGFWEQRGYSMTAYPWRNDRYR